MLRSIAAVVCVLLAAWPAAGAAAGPPAVFLGAAWYPEQWPEEVWDRDLALMRKAGIRMVRIGEYAWSSLEPEEGRYEFGWMERAIEKAAAHGLYVVLGTPSDAPPAWLTSKYPETLRVDENGRRLAHGGRRQFSYTSPKYRELCRAIVEQMAKRFGKHPNVIAWQIGNEYTDDSYDEYSHRLFQHWLREKYKSLEVLNQRWMTAYWSQTYTSWEQIPMPSSRPNPGLGLEYKRFVTDQWRFFQRNQIEAIRKYADPRQRITTNLGGLGWANRFNRTDIAADLDFISWDAYVGQGHLDAHRMGATHDLVRGWKRQNFWVMEIQPGFVDWAPISNALDRGEMRLMLWQAIGHGADCVAFWQWRNALNGQEQYHGTLVGPDGEALPLFEEVAQTGREFDVAAPLLEGTSPVSEVAILHDYDSRWAIDGNRHSRLYDPIEVLLGYYRPLRGLTQAVDIIDPRHRLEDYRLIVAPSLNIVAETLARRLENYVRSGGHLVLGPRSGMKDEFNALHRRRQPGPLMEALGARVEQFYALLDEVPVSGKWGEGKAPIWAEYFSLLEKDVDVLMRYGQANGWLDGQPAVVTRRLGKGTITYIGALLDAALMKQAAQWMVETAGVRPQFGPVPDGVEVCPRNGNGRTVYILLNHNRKPVGFTLTQPLFDALKAGAQLTRVELPALGVAVLATSR